MVTLGRRDALRVLLAAGLAAGCQRRREGELVLGAVTNLAHAPAIVVASAAESTRVTLRLFRSGPRVMEALVAGAIDVGSVGPGPVVVHHATRGRKVPIVVLSGQASGGASFVAPRGGRLGSLDDLAGARVAVPQLGSTQDLSLRAACRARGLAVGGGARGVRVDVLPSSISVVELGRGNLDGAWLPEPWAARAVTEGARRVVDERDLWPDGRFSSALLVAPRGSAGDPRVRALASAIAREAREGRDLVARCHTALTRAGASPAPLALFAAGGARVDFTDDPLPSSVFAFAERAASAGYCPARDGHALFSS